MTKEYWGIIAKVYLVLGLVYIGLGFYMLSWTANWAYFITDEVLACLFLAASYWYASQDKKNE